MTATLLPNTIPNEAVDELHAAFPERRDAGARVPGALFANAVAPPRLVGPDGTAHELPAELYDVLVSVVAELKRGNGVSVVPLHTELTTAEAAELLNVSRPHLIKVLDSEHVPYHRVGTHRRVRLSDLLEYKERRDAERRQALVELHDVAEEHEMPF